MRSEEPYVLFIVDLSSYVTVIVSNKNKHSLHMLSFHCHFMVFHSESLAAPKIETILRIQGKWGKCSYSAQNLQFLLKHKKSEHIDLFVFSGHTRL